MKQSIYLDYHTACKPLSEAVEKLNFFYRSLWGSLDAPHQKGQELYSHVDAETASISSLLGVPQEFYFWHASSGMDGARQIFLHHYLTHIRQTGRNHLLTTQIEQASILLPLNAMESLGCAVKTVDVSRQGVVDLDAFSDAIRPRTSLVSISWADSLTGVIQPIGAIASICKSHDVALHVDASSAVGKIGFRLEDMGCDYISVDGVRFQAPPGAAAVFSRFKGEPHPVNVPMLVAFSESLRAADRKLDGFSTETARLRSRLEALLEGEVLFQDVERLPNVAVVAFPGVHSEALLFLLSQSGVYATIGGGQAQKLSNILRACKVAEEFCESAISFALAPDTTEDEIDHAAEVIGAAVRKLRA